MGALMKQQQVKEEKSKPAGMSFSEFAGSEYEPNPSGRRAVQAVTDFYSQIGFDFEPDDDSMVAEQPAGDILARTVFSGDGDAVPAGTEPEDDGEGSRSPANEDILAVNTALPDVSDKVDAEPKEQTALVAGDEKLLDDASFGGGDVIDREGKTRIITRRPEVDSLAVTRVKPLPPVQADAGAAEGVDNAPTAVQTVFPRATPDSPARNFKDDDTVVDELFVGEPVAESSLDISADTDELESQRRPEHDIELPPDLGFGVGDVLPSMPDAVNVPDKNIGQDMNYDDGMVDILAGVGQPAAPETSGTAGDTDAELSFGADLEDLLGSAEQELRFHSMSENSVGADSIPDIPADDAADNALESGQGGSAPLTAGGDDVQVAGDQGEAERAGEPEKTAPGSPRLPGPADADWSTSTGLPEQMPADADPAGGTGTLLGPDAMDDVRDLRQKAGGDEGALPDDVLPDAVPLSGSGELPPEMPVDGAGGGDPGTRLEPGDALDDLLSAGLAPESPASVPPAADEHAPSDPGDASGVEAMLPGTASQAIAAGIGDDAEGWEKFEHEAGADGAELPPEVDLSEMSGVLPDAPVQEDAGAVDDKMEDAPSDFEDILGSAMPDEPLPTEDDPAASGLGALIADIRKSESSGDVPGPADDYDEQPALGRKVVAIAASAGMAGWRVVAQALDVRKNWGLYCDLIAAMITVISLATIIARLLWYPL